MMVKSSEPCFTVIFGHLLEAAASLGVINPGRRISSTLLASFISF